MKRTKKVKTRRTRKIRTTASKRVSSAFKRGEAGFKAAAEKRHKQEEQYEKRKLTPFTFRLAPGDEAEVVILDDGDPFFVSLHKVQTGPRRWEDEVCIADTGQRCPLCDSLGKEGSYTMMLTVLDRRPYKVKKGPNAGKTIKVSKKLLPVKGRNLPKFERQWKKRDGNWRGLRVMLHRDGEKEAAIGEDIEFLGTVKESVLAKYGETAQPAPYEKIFEIPTADELRKRYNLTSAGVAGAEEFEDDDDGSDLDGVGWD